MIRIAMSASIMDQCLCGGGTKCLAHEINPHGS